MKNFRHTLFIIICLATTAAWAQGPNNSGTYYSSADGKKGEALKTAFFNIIKSFNSVGYDGLIEAYKQTDKRADGYLRDWYSNATSYTWNDRNGNSAEGAGWNREHCVPQSWFSKANPMKSDIVHVLPTDCYVNNRRGSYFFGEVGTATYTSKNGYSKLGSCKTSGYSGTVFEPNDEIKGDIARIYFYMATCYQDRILNWSGGLMTGTTYQPYAQWFMDMLLRWSTQDPIDDVEIARNNAVYSVQGNRNPFVDYPGLEEYVWGDKKTVAFSYDNYSGRTVYNVATPILSVATGTYYEPQTLTMSCTTAGATIYYTTDGSTPTTQSTRYTTALTISESTTVTARAFKGEDLSAIATVTITIRDQEEHQNGEGIYSIIKANADLVAGANYLLVGKKSGDYYAYNGMNSAKTSGEGKEIYLSNGQIDLSENTVVPLRLGGDTSGWTFKDEQNNFYLALNSNSNALNTLTEATADAAKWTITVNSDGTAMIYNKALSSRYMRYNTGSNIFRCYTNNQTSVYLYKETLTTGIGTLLTETSPNSRTQGIYTLDGRKVTADTQSLSSANLPKGIYIVNGRKVVVK